MAQSVEFTHFYDPLPMEFDPRVLITQVADVVSKPFVTSQHPPRGRLPESLRTFKH